MMRISRIAPLFVALCCTLFLSACGSKSNDTAAKGPGQSPAATVNGVVLQSQSMENVVRSSGTVLASESVDLVAEVAGRIDAISFTEGKHVSKDELLLKINDDDLQAQLKKTDLQISLAASQQERQKQLFDKSLASQEQYDIAVSGLNTLKADRENLVASIRKREIRAPFDGVIGLRYVSEGGYITPATRVASIQKLNPLKVDFSIPEKYAGKVSVGDPVQFRSDETKMQFTGTVFAVEPKIDPVTRTLQLRARCDNKEEKLFPGAYLQIELRLKKIDDALMVPTQAIIPVLKGQTVLIRKNGVVKSVPVQTGMRTATSVQITDGLAPGDTVITTGLLQLRPGGLVTVILQ
jgi:membrane fusion protein (multidrug efflux system)